MRIITLFGNWVKYYWGFDRLKMLHNSERKSCFKEILFPGCLQGGSWDFHSICKQWCRQRKLHSQCPALWGVFTYFMNKSWDTNEEWPIRGELVYKKKHGEEWASATSTKMLPIKKKQGLYSAYSVCAHIFDKIF